MTAKPRLTKRERRLLREQGVCYDNNFQPKSFEPLTESQADAYEDWLDGKHLFMYGTAGTGKSYLALQFAYSVVGPDSRYKHVKIVRSAVPTRELGYLPGTEGQKISAYEDPYRGLTSKIYGRADAYEVLKQKNVIEFIPTSFNRGMNFDNCVVFVDECQNMSFGELYTLMTRAGENCRYIFAGDGKQDDLTSERYHEQTGVYDFLKIVREVDRFSIIEFTPQDIVRSGLVKDFIMAKERLGL